MQAVVRQGALTNRQSEVMGAIIDYKDAHDGVSPTIRELMAAVGLRSTSTVARHLAILEHKGYITRQTGLARSIELT